MGTEEERRTFAADHGDDRATRGGHHLALESREQLPLCVAELGDGPAAALGIAGADDHPQAGGDQPASDLAPEEHAGDVLSPA